MNQNRECWLKNELNDSFSFVKREICKGVEFEVYLDDYGQSFHLAWIDPDTKEIRTWCCGSYNNYIWDMTDIAEYILAPKLNHTEKTVLKENRHENN